MKNKFMVLMSLFILLSAWAVLEDAYRVHASEPSSLKTVTLRIEGMT